jgi:hypothetical protein
MDPYEDPFLGGTFPEVQRYRHTDLLEVYLGWLAPAVAVLVGMFLVLL